MLQENCVQPQAACPRTYILGEEEEGGGGGGATIGLAGPRNRIQETKTTLTDTACASPTQQLTLGHQNYGVCSYRHENSAAAGERQRVEEGREAG